ncbi:MAG: RDD family protein [Gammaproteobacteria bacterium]|nr:RDD family protein [Gammaproteobacteria bacterium]
MVTEPSESEQWAKEAVIEYVGFWPRVGATLIDAILLAAITSPLLYAAYGPAYFQPDLQGVVGGWEQFIISHLLPAVAVILFWRYKSATPGKMLIHAKIVSADTLGAPSTGQLVGRYFAYLISILPLFLGLLWVAVDRRKQSWHDKLAGTVVIRSYE